MTFIIALFVAPFTILTFCLVLELLAGLRPLPRSSASLTGEATAVIVVPAHNEAEVLPKTLPRLAGAAEGRASILLVADNCTDSTAAIAMRLGVDVIEREDAHRRGKGFALDFARNHLRSNAPDVVLIVDADCTTDARSVATLIDVCAETGRPCQATNLQKPNPEASPPVQLSTFAFFIKNVIRQRGLQRLAGRAHLLGTGMALPWQIFGETELASGDIVEDLKLGQELAQLGHAPLIVEEATVWSNAETERNTLSQRTRWEGGFLQNALRTGPALLAKNLALGNPQGVSAAINLMIPPLALLMMFDVLMLGVSLVVCLVTGSPLWPSYLLAAALGSAVVALSLAWHAGGSRFATAGALWRIPLYVVWKIPMYLAFARQGAPKEWRRTDRR